MRPLYRFIRDQGYEVVDGAFLRRERDHEEIIGYDDVNQLFWYPEGIARIVLTDKVRFRSREGREEGADLGSVRRLASSMSLPRSGS